MCHASWEPSPGSSASAPPTWRHDAPRCWVESQLRPQFYLEGYKMILNRIWETTPSYCVVHFQMVMFCFWLPASHFHFVTCCCSVIVSCRTLGDPMDCSLPGSSVHEIFQSRILEWVAISSHTTPDWKLSPTAPPRGHPGFTGVLSYSCLGCHHHFPDEEMQVGGLMTLCLVQQPVQGRYGMETVSPKLFLLFHDDKGLLPRLF